MCIGEVELPQSVSRFTDDFYNEIEAGNAAVFAGAGLSVPAGFVDWRDLLRPLAEELDLDVDRETDLVAVAQFHVNANGSNRNRLHRAVIEALAADNPPTENHRLLARLPIATWWTTNYDKLIETALKQAGKIVDIKTVVAQLANTRPRRDAVVYKMHGDIERPEEAVVTRDDYERYFRHRGAFISALAGDLVSKTFLFLGFSFTDPNLDHVLSRVRITFEANQRRHYAIFRKRVQMPSEDAAVFEHARTRQALVIEDLKRFNVRALLVDNYSDITTILSEIERRHRRKTIFVSASASSFEPWGEGIAVTFMRALGNALVQSDVRVATGIGLGVGAALFSGALEQAMLPPTRHIEDAILIRPFPQAISDPTERQRVWDEYRREIISKVGIALFLFGNKEVSGQVVSADGMHREFEIAQEKGVVLLPIGATGSTAQLLATTVLADPNKYLPLLDVEARTELAAMASHREDLMSLIDPIVKLVRKLRGGSSNG